MPLREARGEHRVETDVVTMSSCVTVPAAVVFRDLGDEAVVLHTGTGRYYGLDEVGTRMWTLLAGARVIKGACRGLYEAYDVAPAVLEGDLLTFVRHLAEHGLLVVDEA